MVLPVPAVVIVWSQVLNSGAATASAFAGVGRIVVGGSLVTTDVISVGNLTSFILYAAYVGIGFSGLSSSYAETMKAVGAGSRIWEIMDKKPSMSLNDKEHLLPTEALRGNIEFKNVKLQNLNLQHLDFPKSEFWKFITS